MGNANWVDVTPVILPDNLGLRRGPLVAERHLDGQPLSAEDLAEYDVSTVFFDVFLRHDGSSVMALGPPLVNLESELFPVTAKVNGRPAKVKSSRVSERGLVCLEIPVDRGLSGLTLTLDFAGRFTKELEIVRDAPLPPCRLSLSSLQKNNRQRWINEWQRYYVQQHGVDRVVLYDNGSEELAPDLSPMPEGATIVRWNFPYGPSACHGNKFAQLGSLNHMRLRFGTRSPVLNFDVDELLVVKSRWVRLAMKQLPCLRFNNYHLPYTGQNLEDFSFQDFTLRKAKPKGTSFKYSYRPHLVGALAQHRCNTRAGRKLRSPVAPVGSAYFLHFLGVTTGWKKRYWDRHRPVETTGLVEDLTAANFFDP